jgi:hypothetical protein
MLHSLEGTVIVSSLLSADTDENKMSQKKTDGRHKSYPQVIPERKWFGQGPKFAST